MHPGIPGKKAGEKPAETARKEEKDMPDQEKREKKAEEWSDRIPDLPDRDGEEEGEDEAYESVYRDGSVKHECWKEE